MLSPLESDPCEQRYLRLQEGDRCKLAALWTITSDIVQCTTCAAVPGIPGGQNMSRIFKNWIAFDNHICRRGSPGWWNSMSIGVWRWLTNKKFVEFRVLESCSAALNVNWNVINRAMYPASSIRNIFLARKVWVGRCGALGLDMYCARSTV